MQIQFKVNCASWFSCGCSHPNFTTTAKRLMEHDINHSQRAAPPYFQNPNLIKNPRDFLELVVPWRPFGYVSPEARGCHCCFSAVGSWDLLWKVRTFYVCLHGFPWGALVSPPIKNLPHSPVTVLLTTVLAYSCRWSPGFAVLKSQDGLNAGNEFPYWNQ